MDKLPRIRADLVKFDENWQAWYFPKLVEPMHKWTDRNPEVVHKSSDKSQKRENLYHTKHGSNTRGVCLSCEMYGHRTSECLTDTVKKETMF